MKKSILLSFFLLSICPPSHFVWAQSASENLTNIILAEDSLFWIAYNHCDVERMRQFIADDVEFYHDKGGLTLGLENFIAATKKNLCSNEDFKLKRASVERSIKVFPLKNSEAIYGAIISGEHLFYVLEKGKGERLDGLAKFTHVWVLKNNVWKMSRILSYDHGPAPYVNHRKALKITTDALDQFVGQYKAPHTGTFTIRRENDLLNLLTGDRKFLLYPQSNNSFFVMDRDVTFEFTKNETGNVSRMIVRENGTVVEEAILLNK